MKRWVWVSVLSAMMVAVVYAAGKTPSTDSWNFLSTTDIGAKAFIKAHPKWDGRGVLIAVCDSGVDLGLPGLEKTSDNKPKILDARVFCNEGKITLTKAELSSDEHGKAYHSKKGKWLYGADALPAVPAKGSDVYIGYFKESAFKNSDARKGDLNGNGNTNDVYGLLVFQTEKDGKKQWVGVLDTNGDGNLADEKALGDFSKTRETFALRGRDLHSEASVMGFALNLWPKEKKAALYMADGSHGTHVSGIAAGYEINGQKGYNGIAPGAQILALKIGNNSLSGGATTPGSMISAWRYAVKRAKELKMPLVIQMSYGIGSEEEERSEAERLIDKLLDAHPGVVATVAAGNDGPGLSTVGLPACARDVLSVAAVLPRSSARALFGVSLARDELFFFSSRGDATAKPNVAAPGVAASTVPNYADGDNVFRGTSMASPQAAGACALLLSAAKASGLRIRRDEVMAGIERGATPIPGYGPLDEGYGLINVSRSWTVLKALCGRPGERPSAYTVETESPEMTGDKGPAIFWRGTFYPKGGKRQVVTVKPRFPEGLSADYKARFFEAFDLKSTAPWLRVDKGSVFMEAGKAAKIPVTFDATRLKKPGLYQGEILAYAKGLGSSQRRVLGPEWTVPAAIVVPIGLGYSDNFTYRHTFGELKAGKVQRLFFGLAPHLATFDAALEAPDGQRGFIIAQLFDPEGREEAFTVTREGRERTTLRVKTGDMAPGVWELDLYPYYSNTSPVSLKVTARTFPLVCPVNDKITVTMAAQGGVPEGHVTVTSALPETFKGRASGKIVGSVTEEKVSLDTATWSKTFHVAPGESSVHFRLEMSQQDWNLFTDVAVQILDAGGKAIASNGMEHRFVSIGMTPPNGGNTKDIYTLKVMGATADPDDSSPSWTLEVKEVHKYSNPLAIEIGKKGAVTLYPDHPDTLSFKVKGVPPALSGGASWLGNISFKSDRRPALVLPLEVELSPKK